jgi:hypothetical protein
MRGRSAAKSSEHEVREVRESSSLVVFDLRRRSCGHEGGFGNFLALKAYAVEVPCERSKVLESLRVPCSHGRRIDVVQRSCMEARGVHGQIASMSAAS